MNNCAKAPKNRLLDHAEIAKEAPGPLDIPTVIAHMENSLGFLRERIDLLESKLSPILWDAIEGSTESPEPILPCPLLNKLNELGRSIESESARINSLLERTAL